MSMSSHFKAAMNIVAVTWKTYRNPKQICRMLHYIIPPPLARALDLDYYSLVHLKSAYICLRLHCFFVLIF